MVGGFARIVPACCFTCGVARGLSGSPSAQARYSQHISKAKTRHGELTLERAYQTLLEEYRHEEIPIAVVVKENRHLISVVSLNRTLAPVLGGYARPDREGLLPVRGCGTLKVVVTVTARTRVVLPEVGQEE